jgi:hypothetical protein
MNLNDANLIAALRTAQNALGRGSIDYEPIWDLLDEHQSLWDDVPYQRFVDTARDRFSPECVALLLTVVGQRDSGYDLCAKARGWLLRHDDEFLIEIGLRLGCDWRVLFLQTRINNSLQRASARYPHLADRINEYLSCGERSFLQRGRRFFRNPTDRGAFGA